MSDIDTPDTDSRDETPQQKIPEFTKEKLLARLSSAYRERDQLYTKLEKERKRGSRLFLAGILGTITAGIAGAALNKAGILGTPMLTQDVSPASNRKESIPNMEKLRSLPGLEAVLTASMWEKDEIRGTHKDNLLSPFEVSRHFLGGKFWYTGRANDINDHPRYANQRSHRFALIGRRSKYLAKNGEGVNRFDETTLADAINNLLDYANLDDEQIKEWIIWTYRKSFNVNHLEAKRINIQRDPKTKKTTDISYNPPEKFDSHMILNIPREMNGVSPSTFQGNLTIEKKYVPILGAGNRLLLQSGISPDHDLYVPAGLMDIDKKFRLPLGRRNSSDTDGVYGGWDLTALDLAEAIHWYEEITQKNGHKKIYGTENGTISFFTSCASYVRLDDERIKTLAKYLVKNTPDPVGQIKKITEFVQSLPYIGENDKDYNRPPLITLFNEGSDCNNLTVIWSSLLAALGYEHAILYVPAKKLSTESHVIGGVPADLYPLSPAQGRRLYNGYLFTELTNSWEIGANSIGEQNVIAAETFRVVNGHWKIDTVN